MLTDEGLDRRKEEIKGYMELFGKESHVQALKSIEHLETLIGERDIKINCMQRDITDMKDFPIKEVNIIITDIPYGNIVNWKGVNEDPINNLFENCHRALDKKGSVLVLVADKKQSCNISYLNVLSTLN